MLTGEKSGCGLRPPTWSEFDEMLAVVAQFFDGFENIG
jgi:hypothetical protein